MQNKHKPENTPAAAYNNRQSLDALNALDAPPSGERAPFVGMITYMTYREWVDAGARGYFFAPSVTVNAVRLINPFDRRGGYFVRRDTSDPRQQALRERIHLGEREVGERPDDPSLQHLRHPLIQRSTHTHVIAYDSEPTPPASEDGGDGEDGRGADEIRDGWILTARVERPAEVVRRGWLDWESGGRVVGHEIPWTPAEKKGK